MDIEQFLTILLTPTQSAKAKGMKLNSFKNLIKKPEAPKPWFVGPEGKPHYLQGDIQHWNPPRRSKKRSKAK